MHAQEVADPLSPFLENGGVMILDGGLATELEARGEMLDDPLWSAKVLLDRPEVIREVHLDYLRAGADCIVSASYQATFEGFAARGLSWERSERLLRRSVALALEARELFWDGVERPGRLMPLVAASIGPYGAFLADGSEYTGDYDLDRAGLREFHRRRLDVLADSGADLLACETIPSLPEALALRDLLESGEGPPAWMSFSCRDGERLSDGTRFSEAVARIQDSPRVCAVGVNCTDPRFVRDLLRSVCAVASKPLVAYPNSGESYDPVDKRWTGVSETGGLSRTCRDWRSSGARLLGGCCRIRPVDIAAMRASLGD